MKTILVVEDDDDLRFVLRLLLERAGFQVVEAPNGLLAVALIQSAAPDLLITDLRMPVMDGGALIRWIRGNRMTADLPIIAITAYAVLPEIVSQADAVVEKPFAPERIVAMVAELTGGRRASDTANPAQPSTPATGSSLD